MALFIQIRVGDVCLWYSGMRSDNMILCFYSSLRGERCLMGLQRII
jgi:hypothetical protein